MISLLIAMYLFNSIVSSQEVCNYDSIMQEVLANDIDGSIHKRLEAIEQNFESLQAEHALNQNPFDGILEIPVIVQLLHNPNADNINNLMTHERIQSQILRLNIDFLAFNNDQIPSDTNWGALKANYSISFKLADVYRTETDRTEFSNHKFLFPEFGGNAVHDPVHYLNLYIAKYSGGSVGYFIPGNNPHYDMCVHQPNYFGDPTYKYIRDETWKSDIQPALGRTAVHEVGHWLGLDHIFSGGCSDLNDHVDDTPKQDVPKWGCSKYTYSCNSKEPDMHMNYMSYSQDKCWGLFTKGQKQRSLSLLQLSYANGGRKELTKYSKDEKRYVNDLYFRVLSPKETDEDKICGPMDHLIDNCEMIDGNNNYIYICASTTNNPYVNVIGDISISTDYDNNCMNIIENGKYLCYSKVSNTDSTNIDKMTVDELKRKLISMSLCPSVPTVNPTHSPSPSPTNVPTNVPIPTQVPTTLDDCPGNSFCAGKSDGDYEIQSLGYPGTHYVSCVAGKYAYCMPCSAGLIYNQESGQCEFSSSGLF